MVDGRLPPYSIEFEQATIGGILIDPNGMYKISEHIRRPADFYEPRHKIIFECVLKQFEDGHPVDLLTVSERLTKEGQIDKAGGLEYLMELTQATPTSANLSYYARIVKEKSVLRQIIEVGNQMSVTAYEEDAKPDEVVDKAEQVLFSIASEKIAKGFIPIRDLLSPVFKRIEELQKTKAGITGLPSGYYDLDKLTAGFQKSDLIILAARPSVGKSSLGINVACNAAIRNNKTVAIFSLEMSKEQLVERMISSEARINASDMRRGMLSEDAWPKIGHIMSELYNAPIYIDDTCDLTVLELRAKARKLALEKELSLIIVDYLQLLRTSQKVENRVQEISQITRSLKALSRELSVPIIVQSQLSRSIEQRQDHRPVLSDLRESGSIEQDADVVMFLSPPESQKERDMNIVDLILAKQRNGPVGLVRLKFLRHFTRFESLAESDGTPLDFD